MPLFPAFIDLSDKECLVVGGGKVATRKVEKLLSFSRRITLVAPRICDELEDLARRYGLRMLRRKFAEEDLEGKHLVIVAVDDIGLQERVFELCNARGILCNSVDSPDYCNFIFPSLVVHGDLVIGINTAGKAPAVSKKVRELIQECLPENVGDIVEQVAQERSKLRKGKERQEAILKLVEELFKREESEN